ncbi:putative toxin-antitoxin system toxin component, PIN family [bacterium]|nr:putative toxin-antitoxin system toxin component, PIN family [bacterium]
MTDGLCSKLVLRANKGEFELYTCPIILNEFEEKLRTQFSLTKAEIKEALTLIKEISLTVNPIESNVEVKGVCRDKDDDMVLTCALTAKVDFLVTGDRDLLIIGVYQGINIISPRAFELLFDSD